MMTSSLATKSASNKMTTNCQWQSSSHVPWTQSYIMQNSDRSFCRTRQHIKPSFPGDALAARRTNLPCSSPNTPRNPWQLHHIVKNLSNPWGLQCQIGHFREKYHHQAVPPVPASTVPGQRTTTTSSASLSPQPHTDLPTGHALPPLLDLSALQCQYPLHHQQPLTTCSIFDCPTYTYSCCKLK